MRQTENNVLKELGLTRNPITVAKIWRARRFMRDNPGNDYSAVLMKYLQ